MLYHVATTIWIHYSAFWAEVSNLGLPPWGWGMVLFVAAWLCLASWALATGWGDTSRWEITLISVLSFLVAGVTSLVLVCVAGWTVLACWATHIISPLRAGAYWSGEISKYALPLGFWAVLSLILGGGAFWDVRRKLQPAILQALGVHISTDDSLTDARTIADHLPEPLTYDPRRYFPAAHKKDLMFLGLDERRKPVFLPRLIWRKTHAQVCGPTGTGKGVMACVCLAQSIDYGDGVFVIDPKNDEFAASVMAEACQAAGVPFHLVDLRRGKPAQFDMLAGITKEALNSLFIAGFALGTKGTDADFYRKNDRAAARALAALADRGHVSFQRLAEQAGVAMPEDLAEKCEGFRRSLEEVAELAAPQAPEGSAGAEIDGPIKNGGCLYLIGDMDDEAVVVLQKMLLVRLVQLVSARPRDGKQRHITIFADEIRYMMSKKLGDVLGSVRDKGCNLILAHQGLDDLKTGDVPSPAVVIDNTGLRWLYRSTTSEMAQWIAEQTGQILVASEKRIVKQNSAGGDISESERSISQIQRAKIDQNMVQHLPNGVAVVIGAGPARLAFASPVPVTDKLDAADLVRPATMPETPVCDPPVLSARNTPTEEVIITAEEKDAPQAAEEVQGDDLSTFLPSIGKEDE